MRLPAEKKRYAKPLVVGVVVAFGLAILQISGGGGFLSTLAGWVFQPIRTPVEAVSKSVRNTFRGALRLRGLYVENADLKERVRDLEVQVAAMASVESENQVLRNNLGFAESPPAELAACTVLARDPDGLTQTLLLSCGSNQGIKIGHGATAQGYLVGKVVLVNDNTSVVRLLVSPSVAVDAKVLGRNTSGVVKGSFGSGIILDLVPQTSGVVAGDLVTTAGINELIPSDVLIGSVTEIVRVPGALFDQISVSSPVDLRDLRFVYVIKL